jgi:SAM-dependent methyltransferase
MSQDDYYASPFGVVYSAYMQRPRLARVISRTVWGGDSDPYYASMAAIAAAPRGGTIVDCPCGAGAALRRLAPAQDVRYLGFDLSPAMLTRLRRRVEKRRLPQVEAKRADATEIPLPGDVADLFLSYWGLHCFPDPAAALFEAARVLRPGGRLVGSTFVVGRDSLRQRLLVRPGAGDFGNPGTAAQVVEWLRAAGFAEPAVQRSGPMLFFDARLG